MPSKVVSKGGISVKRLTRKKLGSSYPLKNPASAKIGLFTDYDGFYAFFEAVNRLGEIEDILGDDYDLSRLRDLVKADRDGRCFVSDVKLGDEVFCIPKYSGKALVGIKKGHIQAVSFTRAGKRVRLREYREYNKDFMLGKTAFTTQEAAEEALEGEQHG